MVERNLAKVEVASSSLVSRSNIQSLVSRKPAAEGKTGKQPLPFFVGYLTRRDSKAVMQRLLARRKACARRFARRASARDKSLRQ